MTHRKDEARRIATHSRTGFGLPAGVAIAVVGACSGEKHPSLVPAACGPLDGAVADTDAGPDAGTAVVNCSNPSNVPGVGAVPPGGGPPANSGGGPVIDVGGAPTMGAGGSAGTGFGGSGASFGGSTGFGAGGFFNGIGGSGFAAGAPGQAGMGTGVGAFVGLPPGTPGFGGFTL